MFITSYCKELSTSSMFVRKDNAPIFHISQGFEKNIRLYHKEPDLKIPANKAYINIENKNICVQ